MKYLKYIIVIVAMTINTSSFSQTRATTPSNKITIELKNGTQRVGLGPKHGTLAITIQRNEVVYIQRMFNGKTTSYYNSGTSTPTKECPCGYSCWEDETLQQSICICKSCGGSGKQVLYLKYKL